jgi:hypothetical protein
LIQWAPALTDGLSRGFICARGCAVDPKEADRPVDKDAVVAEEEEGGVDPDGEFRC